MKQLTIILSLVLFINFTNQQCSTTASNSLQTDNAIFYNNYAGSLKRQHLYQIQVSFTITGRVEITASSSSLTVSSSGGADFLIIGGQGNSPSMATILLLIGQDRSWTFIRVQFLVSGRSDFYVGTFSADTYLRQTYSTGSSLTLSHSLSNYQTNNYGHNVIAVLSGLKTSANSFSATVNSADFDPTKGVISVVVSLVSSPAFERVAISYVIFQRTAPFTYTRFSPLRPSTATYVYYGMDLVSNGANQYSGHEFASQRQQNLLQCQGATCPSTCVTSAICFAIQGNTFNNLCIVCNAQQYYLNGECRQRTQICGENQNFDGSKCVCFSNYIMVNQVCYLSCGQFAYYINGGCSCIPGYSYSPFTRVCTLNQNPGVICGANSENIGGRCVCRSGFGLVNSNCVACPALSYIANDGQCRCQTGYVLNTNTLTCNIQCPPNARINNQGVCQCDYGFVMSMNQCISNNFGCPPTQVWTGSRCVCQNGQFPDFLSGNCMFCNSIDRMVENQICTCSRIYYPTLDGCSPCKSNSLYDKTSKQCLCMTGFNDFGGVCTRSIPSNCPTQITVYNPTTGKCDCRQFQFYYFNGFCQPCPFRSTWNGNQCVCQVGLSWSSGICDIVCPANSVRSGNNCICSPGLYLIGLTDSKCLSCDTNSFYVESRRTCYCKDGYVGTFDKCQACHLTCATCSGPGVNQCHTCTNNGILTTEKSCISPCSLGFYFDGNCKPCNANCLTCYNLKTCLTCRDGYIISTTTLGSAQIVSCIIKPTPPNPNDLTIKLRSYVVGNGLVYQGVSLNILPSAILANDCLICDDLLTVQVVSTITTVTTRLQYVKNSQYNFIITFNFGSIAFIPSFQFRVKIKNTHASYFTPAQMALNVQGSITQDYEQSSVIIGSDTLLPVPANSQMTFGIAQNPDDREAVLPPAQFDEQLLAKLFQ